MHLKASQEKCIHYLQQTLFVLETDFTYLLMVGFLSLEEHGNPLWFPENPYFANPSYYNRLYF